MIVLIVVERPEPLRPSRLTISPSPTLHVDAVQDVALAVVGVQVGQLQHGSALRAQACAPEAWSACTEPR